MRLPRSLPPWRLSSATVLLALVFPSFPDCALAGQGVNVALKTSFDSAPYLLELLETAAAENASSYFPILDSVADGHFASAVSDEELYNLFLQLLRDDGHIGDEEGLSSFQFALSIRSAAPRIEAHYQYYNTTVAPALSTTTMDSECSAWVQFEGQQYCSPKLETSRGTIAGDKPLETRLFDRVLGQQDDVPISILYADLNDPNFGHFHRTLSHTAKEGKTSYRLRYKRSQASDPQTLSISGYGVELALKRTDYIVIDDRDDADTASDEKEGEALDSSSKNGISDLKPLSTSELRQLGLKASSYIMDSQDPFETLAQLSQDFPKHSSSMATHNVSAKFLEEHRQNRKEFVPEGSNVVWINGAQVDPRRFDAFALSQHLRHERQMIEGLKAVGISSLDAVKLLSHSELAAAAAGGESQRYDYRDETEGGGVIVWLNNLEKDKRYRAWPRGITTFLQRTYPGQLPSVRRDTHNFIVPIDLSSAADVELVVETLTSFVQRLVPIQFGIVPIITSQEALEQTKIFYHMFETYHLTGVLEYLKTALASNVLTSASEVDFEQVIKDKKVRKKGTVRSLQEVLSSGAFDEQVGRAFAYNDRLGINSNSPSCFINGVNIPRDDAWLQSMSKQVTLDLQLIQKGIFESTIVDETWLPELFLEKASPFRNDLIIPADESQVKFIDLTKLYQNHADRLELLPALWSGDKSGDADLAHLIVIADLTTPEGRRLLREALVVRQVNPGIQVILQHNPEEGQSDEPRSFVDAEEDNQELVELANQAEALSSKGFWQEPQPILAALDLDPGHMGLVLNGRILGPIPSSSKFAQSEFMQLLNYEDMKRGGPLSAALKELKLSDKVDSPLAFAKLVSLVALSSDSDVPEDVFEAPSTVRIDLFNKWESEHTAITTGDPKTAIIQIVASVDPASQLAQRWIPILKVLSELHGVHLRLFLNPKEKLSELPIKRFYRYVLESKPSFDEAGAVRSPTAHFTDVPEDALLNVAMDVPPSWLVAPKESIHDLDNIKLSNVKDRSDVEAIYELENILIEGHSRDVTVGPPPRGAQLLLGTAADPHFADTLVMTNLGYFQFKANPGFWDIQLQEGRSKEVFRMDSAGAMGYNPAPGDHITEVELLSFQGLTLFPRFSRNAGQEYEDVLEVGTNSSKPGAYVAKGLSFAEKLLSKTGLTKTAHTHPDEHAEINIFSVASGHLYERMLNIMMVSVMAHTQRSVHFWFIEQFLSPWFKSFLPHLAAHYGFRYTFVTYKWPHWLRAQSEKQREIWGYKILFLDVLFPLSLPKIIFVDADQIVRTDMFELIATDLQGAPYGFTPMCDSRTEMEGFRFWKTGYWQSFLRGAPYHISALYVVDLVAFRQMAAGDRLRQHYQQLSADPNSLSNLDQDLPNHMQHNLPIHSLGQEWLWCETWCADEALGQAKTIDLCNNPLTKEPKLDRARRQVPEWNVYDGEIDALRKRVRAEGGNGSHEDGEKAEPVPEEEPVVEPVVEEPVEEDETPPVKPAKDEL